MTVDLGDSVTDLRLNRRPKTSFHFTLSSDCGPDPLLLSSGISIGSNSSSFPGPGDKTSIFLGQCIKLHSHIDQLVTSKPV